MIRRWWLMDAEPWQFWLPQSGMPGGILGAACGVAITAILIAALK